MKSSVLFCSLLGAFILISGCSKMYYKTMEAFGKQKRDILVDRVESARDAQEAAKQQFQSALEKFTSVVKVPSSQLEGKYKQLQAEYDRCETKAKAVSTRIADVENVSDALFNEWKSEIKQYTNKDLRRASEQKYKETRARYAQLIGAMKDAEKKIAPVLAAFHDQVLFLKHNLNAQAIASLQDELVSVQSNVADLIKDMNASINEANAFIRSMESTK